MVLEKTLESHLDCKEIKSVNPKGNQSQVFIGRTDTEAEAPILWPPDMKNWLFGKDPDAGRDWRQDEKGMTEYEMAGWHHQLTGCKFEQATGVGDGREAWCAAFHGVSKSQTRLSDWTELNQILIPASVVTFCLFVLLSCLFVLLCLEVQDNQVATLHLGFLEHLLCYLLKEYFLRTRTSGLAELKVIGTRSTKSLCEHLEVYREGPLFYLLFLRLIYSHMAVTSNNVHCLNCISCLEG